MRNDGPDGNGGISFTELDSALAPTSHANSNWGDYDNDQDLDLLLVNMAPLTDDGFIRRYKNEGNGVFIGEDIVGSISVEHGESQWGDYDSDGDLDILIAGNIKENDTYTLSLRIYRNDNENYIPLEVIPCVQCEGWFDLTAATWADYDSDGDMDILLAGNYNSGSQIEGRAVVYSNDGNGNFSISGSQLPAPTASGDRGGTFSWMDIDGDGDLDYFIAGQYFVPGGNGLVEAQMHLYRNDSPGLNNPPGAPSNLNSSVQNNNSVLLSWASPNDDHTANVSLTYDLDLFNNGIPVVLPQRLPEPGKVNSSTTWLLSDLPAGNYQWILRAVDASFSGSAISSGEFSINVLSTDDQSNLPYEYKLNQNFPNPFNPSTKITYSLKNDSKVELIVYDILGNEITKLVNKEQSAGIYEINFDGHYLASGIYFYKINAGSFADTKKMILIK
jgi:hypothetical protein